MAKNIPVWKKGLMWGRNFAVAGLAYEGAPQTLELLGANLSFNEHIIISGLVSSLYAFVSLMQYGSEKNDDNSPGSAWVWNNMDWKKFRQGEYSEWAKFISMPVCLIGTAVLGIGKGIYSQPAAFKEGIDDAKKGSRSFPTRFSDYRWSNKLANYMGKPAYWIGNVMSGGKKSEDKKESWWSKSYTVTTSRRGYAALALVGIIIGVFGTRISYNQGIKHQKYITNLWRSEVDSLSIKIEESQNKVIEFGEQATKLANERDAEKARADSLQKELDKAKKNVPVITGGGDDGLLKKYGAANYNEVLVKIRALIKSGKATSQNYFDAATAHTKNGNPGGAAANLKIAQEKLRLEQKQKKR
jgi:hypothetical protein